MRAAGAGHVGMVKMLVRRGANYRARAFAGTACLLGLSVLDHAALGGHEEIVAYLLRKGAPAINIGTSDRHGMTPLMMACKEGHLGVARRLVKHLKKKKMMKKKEGLEQADNFGRTALDLATANGHKKVVAYLLKEGAQANTRDGQGRTPLMVACEGGDVGVARLFVYYLVAYYRLFGLGGQWLEETDNMGWTALHRAARGGHEEIVSMLLEKGAQANSRDGQGKTPLMRACESGRLAVAQTFLQHEGAQGLMEPKDFGGRTALHHAARGGHEEMVCVLLLAGADPTVKDRRGSTPRDLARAKGYQQCARAFDWWEGERRYALQRARCLHDAYTVHRLKPAAPVPAYLQERAAAGQQALPQVEVVGTTRQQQQQRTAGARRGKRKASTEADSTEQEKEERQAAVLTYVVTQLDSALFTELIESFYLYDPRGDGDEEEEEEEEEM